MKIDHLIKLLEKKKAEGFTHVKTWRVDEECWGFDGENEINYTNTYKTDNIRLNEIDKTTILLEGDF